MISATSLATWRLRCCPPSTENCWWPEPLSLHSFRNRRQEVKNCTSFVRLFLYIDVFCCMFGIFCLICRYAWCTWCTADISQISLHISKLLKAEALGDGGFQYLLAGARANVGIKVWPPVTSEVTWFSQWRPGSIRIHPGPWDVKWALDSMIWMFPKIVV